MEHFWTIVQIAIFGILFPLLDSGGDVNFSIRAIRNKHYLIGCLILSPVIAYIIFICSVWKKGNFDTKKERWFTWIFAVLTIWPPYQAFKLIRNILGKKDQRSWEATKLKLENQVFSIEPWIESIPQYIISVCIYGHHVLKESEENILLKGNNALNIPTPRPLGSNAKSVEEIFGETIFWVDTRIMFPINAACSFLIGVHSIVIYLHYGPLKITSEKFSRLLFIFKLVYVVLSFLSLILGAFDYDLIAHDLGLPGYWSFIFDIVTFIIIPFLLFIAPMIRYLGPKKYARMILRNPQLVILPVVTDYVIGPVNGYGKCKTGSCCWWRSCCWVFCCNACKFEHGNEIGIHKKMSVVKMIYKQVVSCAISVIASMQMLLNDKSEDDWVAISILVAWLVGTVSFMMTLWLGNFTSLRADKLEESDDENFVSSTYRYQSAALLSLF